MPGGIGFDLFAPSRPQKPAVHDLTFPVQVFEEEAWIPGYAGHDVERAMGHRLRRLV